MTLVFYDSNDSTIEAILMEYVIVEGVDVSHLI